MTNVPHHKETSQLICIANQLTGFYMRGWLVVKGLTVLCDISKMIIHHALKNPLTSGASIGCSRHLTKRQCFPRYRQSTLKVY